MPKTLEAYLLAALLICMILSVVITVIVLMRRTPPDLSHRERKERHGWWIAVIFTVTYLGFMSWIDTRDQNIIAELEAQGQIRKLINAGYLRPDKAWFKANLNECPPRTDGMTDQVVMVITTEADGKHQARGCSRIAERQYIVTKGPQ